MQPRALTAGLYADAVGVAACANGEPLVAALTGV
jgi:hypothetical protein